MSSSNTLIVHALSVLQQREFVQLVIDGVNKVIEMEKRLEEGKSIDDLVPDEAK